MKQIKLPYIFGMLVLLCFGCRSTRNLEDTKLKPAPTAYFSGADSSNAANQSWSKFFNDPYLLSLLDTAVHNNFDVFIALRKIEAAAANIRLRNGARLPNVSAVASASLRKFGLYTMDGAGNISTEITPGQIVPISLPDYYVGLQTSWEVDIWGKLRNRKRASLARYLSGVEGKNLVITELVASIATAYYELAALDNELDIIRQTVQLQDDALEIVKVQKKAARANEAVVKQFSAQLLNSKALEIEVLQKITETENLINFLCGRYPQPITRNKNNFADTLSSQIQAGIPSDLLKNRPDIRQAEYELMALKADAKAAKAAFYPSLNISGGIGYQAFKTSFLFTTPESVAYNLLGSLVAPLVNRSAIKAEFRSASAQQQAALYNYQKVIVNGYVEVYNELTLIQNLEKIHELKKQEASELTDAIETTSELFKTGRANYLEVLTTQRNALSAKLQLIDTRKRQYQAITTVYKALGGGWR